MTTWTDESTLSTLHLQKLRKLGGPRYGPTFSGPERLVGRRSWLSACCRRVVLARWHRRAPHAYEARDRTTPGASTSCRTLDMVCAAMPSHKSLYQLPNSRMGSRPRTR